MNKRLLYCKMRTPKTDNPEKEYQEILGKYYTLVEIEPEWSRVRHGDENFVYVSYYCNK